jgi:hypothetical protein
MRKALAAVESARAARKDCCRDPEVKLITDDTVRAF